MSPKSRRFGGLIAILDKIIDHIVNFGDFQEN